MREKIEEILDKLDQTHLLEAIEGLAEGSLDLLLAQLERYDPRLVKRQRDLLVPAKSSSCYSPCQTFAKSGNAQDQLQGRRLLKEGKVGCLILAGGQGTRLGYDGPKGAVPVTAVKGKSCFQLFCEKSRAAGLLAGRKLPICVMTSPLNRLQTVDFFQTHDNFGLEPDQLCFFEQGMLPLMDDNGNWLLDSQGKLAEGPDGNGQALHLFFKTGIWQRWKDSGVEYLNVIFVDNPLADPFDAEFIGFARRSQGDAVLKAVERLSPDEKMGVVAELGGQLQVVEYSEISKDAYPLSSTGMFCIRMDFIERICRGNGFEFPLHLARKNVSLGRERVALWKCERFLFDLLRFADKSCVIAYPRKEVYAPLKNASGDHTLETVRAALLLRDKEQYQALTGKRAPVEELELDPAFYYPSEGLKQKLKGMAFSNKAYISS